MRIYLGGPMSGIPMFNYPAFNDAAARLRLEGHEVFNPAEMDFESIGPNAEELLRGEDSARYRRIALKADLTWICDHAEAIALLPGWERSSGAQAEHRVAVALGLEVIHLCEGGR